MMSRTLLAGAAGALVLSTATGASAAVLIDFGVGGHLTYKLHNTADDTATTVRLDVIHQPFLVDFTGNVPLDQAGNNGQGFAQVDGTPLFDTLLIDPVNFAGFNALQFHLSYQRQAPNPFPSGPDDIGIDYGTLNVAWTLVGGGGGNQTVNILNGNDKFRLYGTAGEQFSTVTLSQLAGTLSHGQNGPTPYLADFKDIKQVSFDFTPAVVVPEPGTWALMITGFGAVGYAVRRRRWLAA